MPRTPGVPRKGRNFIRLILPHRLYVYYLHKGGWIAQIIGWNAKRALKRHWKDKTAEEIYAEICEWQAKLAAEPDEDEGPTLHIA